MFTGIEHIISPINAPWCSWTVFILMLFAIISEWCQPGVLSQATDTLSAHTGRLYKDSPTNFLGQFFVTLFRVGTLALALCLCLYTGGTFRFITFGLICGLIVATLIMKMIVNVLVSYTFSFGRRFSGVYELYANIATIATLGLFPLLLVMIHVGNAEVNQWILGIVTVCFIGMWVYRSWRIFVVSPVAILYFMLYICTLELLPLAALYVVSEKLITII